MKTGKVKRNMNPAKISTLILAALLLARLAEVRAGEASGIEPKPLVLKAEAFRHYVEDFNKNDNELYKNFYPNTAAWDFLKDNIPLLDCPDEEILTTYYFRWWTYRKHIRQTPVGFVVDEFLPTVGWAGKYNTINCAAGHHIREGRWLADPKYMNDYIAFWFTKDAAPRNYSFWAADSVWQRYCVSGDPAEAVRLLPDIDQELSGVGKEERKAMGCSFSGRSGWHGVFHQRRRLSPDDQQLSVRRRPRDCQDCGPGRQAGCGEGISRESGEAEGTRPDQTMECGPAVL